MSPPRIAPKKSIASTPPVTARTRTMRVAALAEMPLDCSTLPRPMTIPVRIAGIHARTVNSATAPIATPTIARYAKFSFSVTAGAIGDAMGGVSAIVSLALLRLGRSVRADRRAAQRAGPRDSLRRTDRAISGRIQDLPQGGRS
jgi:hypothetical protein